MKINPTQLAACLFVLVCTGLLIGLRIHEVSAGNLDSELLLYTGVVEIQHGGELTALEGEGPFPLKRGEIIRTGPNASAYFVILDSVDIELDENTDLELDLLKEGRIELTLHRGRIAINSGEDAPLYLNGKYSHWRIDGGAVTFVHYDFLETMVGATLTELTNAFLIWNEEDVPLIEPISVVETPPSSWEYTDFNFDLDFYK